MNAELQYFEDKYGPEGNGYFTVKGGVRVVPIQRRQKMFSEPITPPVIALSLVDEEALEPLSREEVQVRLQQEIAYKNRLCARLYLEGNMTPQWRQYMQNHALDIMRNIQELRSKE